jgi:tetratricopeptide (TPR) repeat protein
MASGKARKSRNGHQHGAGVRQTAKPASQFHIFDLPIQAVAPTRQPSISVCMIVKNEEENLKACLESLGDLATELIVVDTGSTDRTVEIAQELGANVHSFPWIGDFAAARNESISHATCDWILWVDGDDRLNPAAVAQLKRAATSGAANAYLCRILCTRAEGGDDITEHVRLFRNHLGIRFVGAIHETILPDLYRMGIPLARTNIEARHVGYDASPDVRRKKSARNLEIIEREMAIHPESVNLIFYRGQARGGLGDLDGTVVDMREYLSRTQPGPLFAWQRSWCFTSMTRVFDIRQDKDSMEPLLEDAIREFPDDPNFLMLQGRLLTFSGKTALGMGRLQSALKKLSKPSRGFTPPLSWIELSIAECARAMGRAEEAVDWAEKSWTHGDHWEKATVLLSRLHLEAGRLQDAEDVLTPLMSSTAAPEPWSLLSELRRRQGRDAEAEEALREARTRGLPEASAADRVLAATGTGDKDGTPTATRILREGLAYLSADDPMKAAESFADAIQENPSDPDGYRYLAAALQKMGREEEALQAWEIGLSFQKDKK